MSATRRSPPSAPRFTRSVAIILIVAAAALAGVFYLYPRAAVDATLARDGAPNWAPDGRSLVFISEIDKQPADIYVMAADGSRRRRLTTTPAIDSNPAFSPDGTKVAFESDRDGNFEIYVMDASGANVRRLTNDPASDLSPAWSPDGTRLAFMSDRNGRASTDIYTMNASDGGALERLTDDLSNWAPQFSPDGRQVALQVNVDIFIIDLTTRQMRRLTTAPMNGMNPTWSPDGRRVAFVTTRNKRAEIFSMNVDGTDERTVISRPNGAAIDARWSPDGSKIAFVFIPEEPAPGQPPDRQAIYTIELASGTLTRLSR